MSQSTVRTFNHTPCHMQAFGELVWPVPCSDPGNTSECAGCLVGDELLDVEFRDNEAWVWRDRDWTSARYAQVYTGGSPNVRIVDEREV
jgi:hypothetical protein